MPKKYIGGQSVINHEKSKISIDTAIQFIDFHRFPLTIDKNHVIATDFYRQRFLSIDYSGTKVPSCDICVSLQTLRARRKAFIPHEREHTKIKPLQCAHSKQDKLVMFFAPWLPGKSDLDNLQEENSSYKFGALQGIKVLRARANYQNLK